MADRAPDGYWAHPALGNKIMAATLVVAVIAAGWGLWTLTETRKAAEAAWKQAAIPAVVDAMWRDADQCDGLDNTTHWQSVRMVLSAAGRGNFEGPKGVNSILKDYHAALQVACPSFQPATPDVMYGGPHDFEPTG